MITEKRETQFNQKLGMGTASPQQLRWHYY